MGVLVDQLKHLSAHPNQFQAHAQASLRLLERRGRRKQACCKQTSRALASIGEVHGGDSGCDDAEPPLPAQPPLRGVLSEPSLSRSIDAASALKEVHSQPELGRSGTDGGLALLAEGPSLLPATPLCDTDADPQRPETPPPLRLRCGSAQRPHPHKADAGGEDSFFICPHGTAAGVADGVGEWEWRFRVNPRAFADELMDGALSQLAAAEPREPEEAKEVKAEDRAAQALAASFAATRAFGSATALVASISESGEELGIASLGDSGARQIRWLGQGHATVVAKTVDQQHSFNCPYQLSRLPTPEDFPKLLAEGKTALVKAVQRCRNQRHDQPEDAELYTFNVQEGDLLVFGTDGVFDNLHDSEVCDIVQNRVSSLMNSEELDHAAPEKAALPHRQRVASACPADLAAAVARGAQEKAADAAARSPFSQAAKQAGLQHIGGKMDDITVVVAWVTGSN